MIPDLHQRESATAIDGSFAVTAPAGSGKTGLLTQRVLHLLACVDQPEEIICITFTRKAAREMRDRILAALEQANAGLQGNDPHAQNTIAFAELALRRDQKMGWQLLANPHRLNISTIDGLCAQLARRLPITAGIGASLVVSETPELLYQAAIQHLLEQYESDAQLRGPLGRILQYLDTDSNRLERLLTQILASREQWLRLLIHQRQDLPAFREQLQDTLFAICQETLQALHTALRPWQETLLELNDFATRQLESLQEDSGSDHGHEALYGTLPEPAPAQLEGWRNFTRWLLTKEGEWRKTLTKKQGFPSASREPEKSLFKRHKQQAMQLIGEMAEHPQLLQLLQDLHALPDPEFSEQQWDFMAALCELLPRLVAELMLVFRDQGEVDYAQITSAALTALGTDEQPTDLAMLLDYRINHILVDEFQDTSSAQFSLLTRLTENWQDTEGRTLFIVGDGMQSCYGFRDANVGLFQIAREQGIGAVQLETLNLQTNFRSGSDIVAWVNSVFNQAFPDVDDVSQGAVAYRASVGLKPASTPDAVQLYLCPADDNRRTEAAQVVKLVQETLSSSTTDSIAILVRNRNHLALITRELQRNGIAWQALDIDPLAQRPIINDLLTLTRALTNPADEIAWLALLRAPWCGLTLDDMYRLKKSAGRTRRSIWRILQNETITNNLSAAGSGRIAHLMTVLAPAIANRQRRPLRDWLHGCWLALGGPNQAYPTSDLALVRDYFDLLEQHSTAGGLENISEFERQIARQFASNPRTADCRVQIMTMHKAKGLEFDHVILPGLDRSTRTSARPIFLWHEFVLRSGKPHLLLSPIAPKGKQQDDLFDFIQRAQKTKATYEEVRLFYVACTRAIKRLSLVACAAEDNNGDALKQPAKGSMLGHIWPMVAEQGIKVGAQSKTNEDEPIAPWIARITMDRLP